VRASTIMYVVGHLFDNTCLALNELANEVVSDVNRCAYFPPQSLGSRHGHEFAVIFKHSRRSGGGGYYIKVSKVPAVDSAGLVSWHLFTCTPLLP